MRALVLFGLSLVVSASALVEIQTNYHESVGIPTAEKIAVEEAILAKIDLAPNDPRANRIIGGVLAPANAHPYFVSIILLLFVSLDI